MPEGDTLRRTAEALRPRLVGNIAVQPQGEMRRLTYHCPRCQGGSRDRPPKPAGARRKARA